MSRLTSSWDFIHSKLCHLTMSDNNNFNASIALKKKKHFKRRFNKITIAVAKYPQKVPTAHEIG